jgi:hypothetical protein
MLEVKQGHHQADRQSGPVRRADSCTGHSHGGTIPVRTLNNSASTITVLKNRRQVRFDLRPRHAVSQHSQRVAKVDHGVKPGAENIGGCHREHSLPNSQKLIQIGPVSGSSDHWHSPQKSRIHAGCRSFATPTKTAARCLSMAFNSSMLSQLTGTEHYYRISQRHLVTDGASYLK